MQRVKKPKGQGSKKERQISSFQTTEFILTICEAILRDDFKFTSENMDKFKHQFNQYCGYISKGAVSFREIREIIERKKNED